MTPWSKRRIHFKIRWNPGHKGSGVALKDLPVETGSWEYSPIFRDVLVAKEWGFQDPLEFWAKSPVSRAYMIAFVEASGAMESFADRQRQEKK